MTINQPRAGMRQETMYELCYTDHLRPGVVQIAYGSADKEEMLSHMRSFHGASGEAIEHVFLVERVRTIVEVLK